MPCLAAERLDVARLPAVEEAEAGARVVELVVHVGVVAAPSAVARLRSAGPDRLRLAHHPVERDERHALLRIAAADVRVRAREPHLLDARTSAPSPSVPEQRLERVALVVDRERLAGMVDAALSLRSGT